MTIEAYNKATKILEEKKLLEDELRQLEVSVSKFKIDIDFKYQNEYTEICNRLFALGQEFAAL